MWKRFKAFVAQFLPAPLPYVPQTFDLGEQKLTRRSMRATDVDAALAIERAIYQGTPWDRFAFLSELQKRGRTLYLVCEDNDNQAIVGYIGAYFRDARMHVTILAVAPEWQGRGLGRHLMQAMIAVAQEQGCDRVTLEVAVDNMSARHLYRSLGFQDGVRRVNYYTEEHKDALDMKLTLTPTTPLNEGELDE